MKKLIWVFGKLGSGKETLIEDINNNADNIKEIFDIEKEKISCVDIPYNGVSIIYDAFQLYNRKRAFCDAITNFLNDDNDILILIGQYIDHDNRSNNAITSNLELIASQFPNLDKEIMILNPNDPNVLYERFKNTDFFKSDYEFNLNKYSMHWLNFAIQHMRESLFKYQEMGYKVYEVDTTGKYVINDSVKIKVRGFNE